MIRDLAFVSEPVEIQGSENAIHQNVNAIASDVPNIAVTIVLILTNMSHLILFSAAKFLPENGTSCPALSVLTSFFVKELPSTRHKCTISRKFREDDEGKSFLA